MRIPEYLPRKVTPEPVDNKNENFKMLLGHSEKNHSKNIVKVNLDRFHSNSYKYLAKFE